MANYWPDYREVERRAKPPRLTAPMRAALLRLISGPVHFVILDRQRRESFDALCRRGLAQWIPSVDESETGKYRASATGRAFILNTPIL